MVADLNAGVPGTKLGSERELAERYGTSRSSLRQVLAALEEAGLVDRAIGRAGGIFISHAQVQRSLSDVVGVPAFLASQGYVAGTRVLSTKITVPDRTTQQALRIGADDFVIEIQRVRLADGSPISLELAQFPADAFPGLLERELGGSIYEILETHYGLVTSRADERIEAVNATPEEADLFGDQAAVGPAADHADHLRPARRAVRVLPRPVPRRPHPTRRHGEGARDRRPAVGGHRVGGPAEPGNRHQGQLTDRG